MTFLRVLAIALVTTACASRAPADRVVPVRATDVEEITLQRRGGARYTPAYSLRAAAAGTGAVATLNPAAAGNSTQCANAIEPALWERLTGLAPAPPLRTAAAEYGAWQLDDAWYEVRVRHTGGEWSSVVAASARAVPAQLTDLIAALRALAERRLEAGCGAAQSR